MLDDAMSTLDLVVRRAVISSTCAPGWTDNVRCTSTGDGGWSFAGTQTAARPAAFISMITAICDEDDQDQSQTSVDLRNSALPDHALIEATGMPESEIAALCDGWLTVSASLALILGRVFGNSADFWLNVQQRTDLWKAMHSPVDFDRLARATPLIAAA